MKFHCTYCGQAIEPASNSTGALVTCHGCNAEVPVPKSRTKTPTKQPETAKIDSDSIVDGIKWGTGFRRMFLYGLIGCFVVAAATAILALLSSELGEIQAKILLTTLSLGVYSLTGLCCAILADQSRFKIFSAFGVAISIAGAVFAIVTNWELVTGWEIVIRGRFMFLIIAIAFAHAALLMMIKTSNRTVRIVRLGTICIIVVIAAVLLASTISPGTVLYSWMLLSILGVLDVLGTVATPILHLATGKSRQA